MGDKRSNESSILSAGVLLNSRYSQHIKETTMLTKTQEQLQVEEVNKFNLLCKNNKGIEFSLTLLPKSEAYRLSVKLQNPEYRACELAELIIKKPILQPAILQH